MLSTDASLDEVIDAVERVFGAVDFRSDEIAFTFTDYYAAEMGQGLRRVFLTVSELVDPSRLAEFKRRSDELETRFCRPAAPSSEGEQRRRVNLDPGLLTLGRLILASTKDNAQRVPLSDGIYAEITLLYRKGDFEPLRWTYPDYQSASYREVLRDIRHRYKKQLEDVLSAP